MRDLSEKTTNRGGDGFEIDLSKLIMAYVRKWWLILLCVAITTAVTMIYTANFVTPKYTATVSIYVNNIGAEQTINYLSDSNLNAAQRLVQTYIQIAKSDRVMNKVAEVLNNRYTASQLKAMFSASKVAETEIFQINITMPDPAEAARIANTIADVAPVTISELIEGT
ncbi:MAG: hypothetical protein IKN53_02245, partial [Oscillibacter sp.]|nr:hypothetical protein [Oscillibacter sp.]